MDKTRYKDLVVINYRSQVLKRRYARLIEQSLQKDLKVGLDLKEGLRLDLSAKVKSF
jgi:hypothetical protein